MKLKLPKWGKTTTCVLRMSALVMVLVVGGISSFSRAGQSNQTDPIRTAPSDPWQTSQIIQPEALAKALSATTGQKPLVLCVGFPVLYQGGHIVGSKLAGPAAKPDGIRALKRGVEGLPRDKQIVLYCGCCPWEKCPNIRPAFRTLAELGFTNVKLLSLPTDFRQDWVAKGFPVEKGDGAK